MEWGELLTRGTAQIAVACYLSRVGLDAAGRPSDEWNQRKRALWTLGCLALWLHVAAAFHFVHDWSHTDAIQHTAEQTGRLTGWFWGGGVYVNYAFALFWLTDAVLWWRRGLDYPHQSRGRFRMMHGVFAFLMFNATVVFGPVYWRYVGAVFLGVCIAARIVHRRRTSDRTSGTGA